MAATNNPSNLRTMTTLPTDIITQEIFPKLPAKSLLRFKCVSKSFNVVISSVQFIDLHLRQSNSTDANRFLILRGAHNSGHLFLLDVDSPHSAATLQLSFQHCLQEDVSIVGSVNGLICVRPSHITVFDTFKHFLINPTTRVYREINLKSSRRMLQNFKVSFGFGFDDINNDYKLVRITENVGGPYAEDGALFGREVMVYSLKSNSWKLVEDVDVPSDSMKENANGVLLNSHLLHWVFACSNSYRIRCFDVRYDKWYNDVPLGDSLTNQMSNLLDIGVLNGCLCLSINIGSRLSKDVWVMKEYGVKDSWVKLFEISPPIDNFFFSLCGPFGFRKGSKNEVLLRGNGNSKLIWYDIGSKICSSTEKVEGIPLFADACFLKGSLAAIPRGGHKIQAS